LQNPIKDASELDAIVRELWMLREREFQYCAQETLFHYRKLWMTQTIKVIEHVITTKSWWDTADFIAYDCGGSYFKMFPKNIKTITGRWNASANMWLQRSSLLFQKRYKKATDTTLLTDYILHIAASKEFFIQKAIGWILREYAKTDADWVRDFVKKHELATLSQKEAMKHL
jgi:3-methyladenine DNA glycosylase AlkD